MLPVADSPLVLSPPLPQSSQPLQPGPGASRAFVPRDIAEDFIQRAHAQTVSMKAQGERALRETKAAAHATLTKTVEHFVAQIRVSVVSTF